jgi:four helix bundle protein
MALAAEETLLLQAAEAVADGLWKLVLGWDPFARETMGKQLVRACDSIGANIAEAFGRFHYGEKLIFFYYARGSLFGTKYWLNRAVARNLVNDEMLRGSVDQHGELARQINALTASTQQQRTASPASRALREPAEPYDLPDYWSEDLFSEAELAWLSEHSPITNF